MKGNILFFLLIAIQTFNCKAHDEIKAKAIILDSLFKNCKGVQCEKKFFQEFPSDFKTFENIYGFDDNSPKPYAKILYNVSEEHTRYFCGIKSINDTIFLKKMIHVSIGGKWDADAISIFQMCLRERILNKIDLTGFLLSKLTSQQVYDFWIFYFDEPHADKKVNEKFKTISNKYPEIYKSLLKAHQFVVDDWEKNG